jgi:bacteriocin-like protein
MKTNVDVKETILEELELQTLDEKEMSEITGGGVHYEWVDGKLILVYE